MLLTLILNRAKECAEISLKINLCNKLRSRLKLRKRNKEKENIFIAKKSSHVASRKYLETFRANQILLGIVARKKRNRTASVLARIPFTLISEQAQQGFTNPPLIPARRWPWTVREENETDNVRANRASKATSSCRVATVKQARDRPCEIESVPQ